MRKERQQAGRNPLLRSLNNDINKRSNNIGSNSLFHPFQVGNSETQKSLRVSQMTRRLFCVYTLLNCIISINIGRNPLTKHSTAITIRISPIKRIITLLPVSPKILTNRVEALNIR